MTLSKTYLVQKARILKNVGPMLAAFSIVLAFAGCGGEDSVPAQPQKKAPLVQIETIATGPIQREIELTGEVTPIESIQISSMVEGPIGYCPWREGDRVETGQKLIEIDREMYRAEVKAAEAALAVAQATLSDLEAGTRPEEIEKARQSVREAEQSAAYEKADFDRIAQLVETGALPGEDQEKARVKLTTAEAKLNAARQQFDMLESGFTRTAIAVQQASVKEAEAKLALAKARLNECIIAAPFAGTITKVFVRQGDMAAMKAPLLQMADMESLAIRCVVPETQAGVVKRGMQADVRLDALPGVTLPAEVERVYPELDARMRTRTIELAVKDDSNLASGMFGRVRLIIESIDAAVTVPVQAVIVTPAGAQVAFVAAAGKAVQRKVQTGIEANGRVQIRAGLEPGEHVIVAATVNDGVLLLTFANELRELEGLSATDAVLQAAKIRLRPRVMTTIAILVGFVPLALAIEEGGDMLQPMAAAAIGGLLMEMLVALYLMPCLYIMASRKPKQMETTR